MLYDTIMEIKQRLTNLKFGKDEIKEESHDNDVKSSNVVSIVFRSLILDLLAFTMILPLLPALLDYYKEIDDKKGLYTWILKRIQNIQIYLNAPDKFSTVLFGGKNIFQVYTDFIYYLYDFI